MISHDGFDFWISAAEKEKRKKGGRTILHPTLYSDFRKAPASYFVGLNTGKLSGRLKGIYELNDFDKPEMLAVLMQTFDVLVQLENDLGKKISDMRIENVIKKYGIPDLNSTDFKNGLGRERLDVAKMYYSDPAEREKHIRNAMGAHTVVRIKDQVVGFVAPPRWAQSYVATNWIVPN